MSASEDARTVHVTGLSEKTSEAELRKFFSFCGALDDVKLEAGKATLTFNRASAAKTASFLSGGTLDGSTITVTSSGAATPGEDHSAAHVGDDIQQQDKPRAAIAAEYLASGYALSDQVIARAIDLDNKHGVTKRFSDFFSPLVSSAAAKAKELDAQKGISQRATSAVHETDQKYGVSAKSQQAAHVGRSYYEAALSSSFGARLQAFYLQSAKQVTDVHEEARRIADSRKPHSETGSTVDPVTAQGSTLQATPQVPLPSASVPAEKA